MRLFIVFSFFVDCFRHQCFEVGRVAVWFKEFQISNVFVASKEILSVMVAVIH